MTDKSYLFKSERLGFRNWLPEDIEFMAALNADPDVMEFFPSIKSKEETIEFIERMKRQFDAKKYCYFAVDTLSDNKFIGFIGIMDQTYDTDFTPCVDIGWRLKASAWGKGFATEGATRCLNYAFTDLDLKYIVSVASKLNVKSINVMKKIGMHKVKDFIHPLLKGNVRLEECVLYDINLPIQK